MRKTLTIFTLLVLAAVITGCTTTVSTDTSTSTSSRATSLGEPLEITSGDFVANVQYQGNREWQYQVSGEVATPCHDMTVDAQIAESFPEQVTLIVTVTPTAADEVCAQVITNKKVEGTFSADEKASVRLAVE